MYKYIDRHNPEDKCSALYCTLHQTTDAVDKYMYTFYRYIYMVRVERLLLYINRPREK